MRTVREELNSRDAYNKRQREIDRENRATLSFGETCDAMDKEFMRKVYKGSDPNWKHWGYSFDDQFFVCTVAEDNPRQFCFETYVNRDRVDENTRRGYFGDPSELVALFWEYIDSFVE